VVILASGTGDPFVTTDTAAALRAAELNADVILKATKVDGIYSDDPEKVPDATRYTRLTYDQVIDQRLEVMDFGAINMCRENGVAIVVFTLREDGNMKRVVLGEDVGTTITDA
jgi:uridylate kinase